MKHFAKVMLLALGLGLIAVVLSSFPSQPAAAAGGGPTVTINPTPLPVTGSVNAAVTGTVGINSLPAVTFNGTQPVNVTGGTVSASFPNPLPVQPVKQSTANYVTLNCGDLSWGPSCSYVAGTPRPACLLATPSSPPQPAFSSWSQT